jgi:hypothetical protein
VTEPVDEEPEIATREAAPDFSQFGGGVAFAEALEEISATPEAAVPPVEPTPVVEAEPPIYEAPVIEPEVSASSALEIETTPEMPTPSPVVEPPLSSEPVFIEDHAAPEHTHDHEHGPEHGHEHPPAAERTMMFRAPAEIAEPILSDELAPPPAVETIPIEPPAMEASNVEAMPSAPLVEAAPEVTVAEPAPVEAAAVAAPESEPTPEPDAETGPHAVAATTLDSYSLSEAAAGNVHVSHAEPTPEPAAPPVVEAPEAAAAEVPKALDSSQVYSIVYMVVAKMSPRLPPAAVEGIAKPIADEINAELNAGRTKNS